MSRTDTIVHEFLDKPVEAKSVMDAALDADALFTPQIAPLALPDGTVPTVASGKYKGEPEFRTVYRETSDGEQVLLNAAVSPGYHAGSYQQLFATADALFPGTLNSFRLIEKGRKVAFTQTIGEAVDLGGGDTVINHLMYVGSLDSTWASACYGYAERVFCTNQLPMGLLQLSQKRTVNHDALLFNKAKILAESVNVFEQFVQDAGVLRSIEVDERTYRRILAELLPEPAEDAHGKTKALHDRRMVGIAYFWEEEVERVGRNAWALFNAVQSFEFHRVTKGNEQKQAEVVRDPNKGQPLAERVRELVLV